MSWAINWLGTFLAEFYNKIFQPLVNGFELEKIILPVIAMNLTFLLLVKLTYASVGKSSDSANSMKERKKANDNSNS